MRHLALHRRSRLLPLLLAVPLLGAVACGGDDGAAATGADADLAEVDPILAKALDGRSLTDAYRAVEERVQRCMTELGWEYTVVPLDPALLDASASGLSTTADAEFVATYGYGITTIDGEDLPEALGGPPDDPNATYRRSLSDAEGARYDEDLYGAAAVPQPVEGGGGGGGAGEDGGGGGGAAAPELAGCAGEAVTAELGPSGMSALTESYARVEEVVRADPRTVDAEAAWAACMAAAGFDFARPEDAVQSIVQRAGALGPDAVGPERDALRAEELATAGADRACAVDTLDPVLEAVRKDAMATVADSAGQGGGAAS